MASPWLEWLAQNHAAKEDFLAWLDARIAQVQRTQDEAPTWEATLEARGAKKSLDGVRTYVNMTETDERDYARLRAVRA